LKYEVNPMSFNDGLHEPRPDEVVQDGTDMGAVAHEPQAEGPMPTDWHSEAGRKGAHRVHQLIKLGRLYEQEHGLKRGRQRLRQLMELGKLYEQEHGIATEAENKTRTRLSRMERDEVLQTLLECMIRVAKPSFRADFERMLGKEPDKNHAT
jgi:hypothetical protein